MFDILVYLYETYYRPEACPDAVALTKKLSAVGFEHEEISEALDWLGHLVESNDAFANAYPQQSAFSFGLRIYPEQESNVLGTDAIGFIQFLELAKVLDANQREIVIERALAVNESPMPLDKLKIIVLMMLWSQGQEPDALIFDELFADDTQPQKHWLH
ncbi:MAG: DUF494 domain-containing protein [Glaciimonas sp.]|nr:DUF494 domain-containing protein [Glaciimonas sp.]